MEFEITKNNFLRQFEAKINDKLISADKE